MKSPFKHKLQAVLAEISIYTIFFGLSMLLPMCTFYFLGSDESITIVRPQYIHDFPIAYLFPVCYAMVLFAFFSARKILVLVISILVITIMILAFLLVQLGFAWWGASPFHPDLGTGYLLSHLLILVLVVRTFMWSRNYGEIGISRKTGIFFTVLSALLPVALVIVLARLYIADASRPIMRSEWTHTVKGIREDRLVREESWDYDAYGAYADKYFSKSKGDASAKFQLDSVKFTYFDDNVNIVKQFTRNARNGKLDVEEILENND